MIYMGMDLETCKHISNLPFIYAIGIYYVNEDYYIRFNEFSSFYNWLVKNVSNSKIMWIFHNAGYDLPFLFQEFKRYSDEDGIEIKSEVSEKFDFLKTNIKIKRYNIQINIYDTISFRKGTPLRDYLYELQRLNVINKSDLKGELYHNKYNGFWKDDNFYYLDEFGKQKIETSRELDIYLKNDVANLYRIRNYIFNIREIIRNSFNEWEFKYFMSNTYVNWKYKTSIGSYVKTLLSLKLFYDTQDNKEFEAYKVHDFFDDVFRPWCNISEILPINIQNSLKGGLTFFNKNLTYYIGKIGKIDINSAYTDAMVRYRLPYGELSTRKRKGYDFCWLFVSFESEIEWNEDFEWMSRSYFIGNIKVPRLVSLEEMELIKKYSKKLEYKLIRRYWQKTTFILSKNMKELYEIKNKSTKGTLDYLVSKLVINVVYGKLAERNHNKKLKFNDETFLFEEVREDKEVWRLNTAGVYITFKVREKLINKMIDIMKQGGQILYGDTDSIIYTNADKINVNEGKDLGSWTQEATPFYDEFFNPKVAKKYFLHRFSDNYNEAKTSGFKTSLFDNLTYEELKKVFNVENNVLFIGYKTHSSKDKDTQITIITDVNVLFHTHLQTANFLFYDGKLVELGKHYTVEECEKIYKEMKNGNKVQVN